MKGRIIICCLLFSLMAAAQVQETVDSVRPEENITTLMGRLRQVQQYLDEKAQKKVDPNYIEVPVKPWRVIMRYKMTDVDVDYNERFDQPGTLFHSEWQLSFNPPSATSIGIWAGYRGTGISYSFPLTKGAGRNFSVSSTGAKYGFNFRLRRFSTDDARFTTTDYENGVANGKSIDTTGLVNSPIWIRSVYVNGYYVFNGRRYSQAAAYNQSVFQRRSAGSLLVGATWYQSSFDYSDIRNILFMLIGHGIHRIKVHQANIGIGYGYNFVPCRGLVINAMAMPTISVYNRVKVYKYDFNYDLSPVNQDDDYGQWNSETKTWANGKTHKSLFMMDTEKEQAYYWNEEPETNYGRVQFNVDLRLGIAYNWKDYFIGLQAQFNRFSYKKDSGKVVLVDAYARLALGIRL